MTKQDNLLNLIGYLIEMLIDYGYDIDGIIRVLKSHKFTDRQIKEYNYLRNYLENNKNE